MRLLLRSAASLQGTGVSRLLWPTVQVVKHPTYRTLRLPFPKQGIRHVIAMATAQEVRATLVGLLQTIDPNTATERKIREQVAEKLGDISEHKKLIKTAIDDYLTDQLTGGATATTADDDEDPAESPKPKRQRTAAAATAATAGSSNEGAPEGGIMLDTQGLKWASLNTFKGHQFINIRNYYRNKDTGALGPSKKGISLNPTVWAKLQGALPQLKAAVDDGNEDYDMQLTDTIKAAVNKYQGKLQVDIREYYEDGGQLKPGLKGIALLPDQFEALLEAAPKLSSQLESNKSDTQSAGINKPATAGDTKPAAVAAGGKKGGGSSSGGPVIDLGGKKRAAISDFGGGGVDLRETYEKDGQMLPGKKGILLKPAQWNAVCAAADDITKAFKTKNMKYQLDLGNKRIVQLSEFRNQLFVAIREHYEKDGKLLPGTKGLNMLGDQWYKLVEGMDDINEHLK